MAFLIFPSNYRFYRKGKSDKNSFHHSFYLSINENHVKIKLTLIGVVLLLKGREAFTANNHERSITILFS